MMGLRNPQRGFLGGVSGARPRMAGILSGDQPEIDMGDFPTRPPEFPQAIPQPAPKQRGGLFGKQSGLWKALGAFGDAFSEGPPIYTQQILAQRELEAEEQRRQRERAEGREDKQWEWANKPKTGEEFTYFEDNAGNRWRQHKATGAVDPAPAFIDTTPKEFVHEGMRFSIPNPYATGAPQAGNNPPRVTDEATYSALPPGTQFIDDEGNLRTKAGGGAGNGPGTFPGH